MWWDWDILRTHWSSDVYTIFMLMGQRANPLEFEAIEIPSSKTQESSDSNEVNMAEL